MPDTESLLYVRDANSEARALLAVTNGSSFAFEHQPRVNGAPVATGNPMPVTFSTASVITQTSTAVEGGHVFNNGSGVPGAGILYALQVNVIDVSGWVLLYDALAVPVDGAVTPVRAWQVQPNTTLEWYGYPIPLQTGCVLALSEDPSPFTQSLANAAVFSAQYA